MKLFTKTKDKKLNTNRRSGGGNFSCRHPKLWSYIKSNVKAFFITGAITFVVSVSATTILHSRQVRYKNDKSVEQAINELYEKADEIFTYHIGDEIQVNGIGFYVIADSPRNQDYVVALKSDPLTVTEVNLYGEVGTENNYVNRYTRTSVGTARNMNGYGGMAFYSSETCGFVNNRWYDNCVSYYSQSHIKQVVDNWSSDQFHDNQLKIIQGLNARLLSYNELLNLCQSNSCQNSSYTWLYSNSYEYWLQIDGANNQNIKRVNTSGEIVYAAVHGYYGLITVRPVINVYKSAITRVSNN